MRKPRPIAELLAVGLSEVIEVGDCVEWQGPFSCKGVTPVVKSREGKTYTDNVPVCRLLWAEHKGPIPDGLLVYRTCCNNACVCLDHLAVGTRKQWHAHRRKMGLSKHAPDHIAKITRSARNRPTTINSLEKAREVRSLLGEYTRREIAEKTGVSRWMVDEIAIGTAWKDHTNPFTGLGA